MRSLSRCFSRLENAIAILHWLESVGEAASRITKQRQNELPQISWVQIIAWSTVTQDLPPLIQQLEDIIRSEHQS